MPTSGKKSRVHNPKGKEGYRRKVFVFNLAYQLVYLIFLYYFGLLINEKNSKIDQCYLGTELNFLVDLAEDFSN
jgi:hypothetical protein